MEQVVVARIGKPHGLRGEVTVQVHTDDPGSRFVDGAVFATDPAEAGPLTVRTARVHKGILLLGFEQSPDRDAAEALRGTKLVAEAEDSQDDEDAWYPEDLVGLSVVDTDGAALGTVVELHTRPVQDLLEIELPSGQRALVPFVEQIVPEVDLEVGQVVLDPPPGLLDGDA